MFLAGLTFEACLVLQERSSHWGEHSEASTSLMDDSFDVVLVNLTLFLSVGWKCSPEPAKRA